MDLRVPAVCVALLATVLAGCALLPPEDGQWWYQPGIQCEPPPWRDGPPEGERAQGPYDRDPAEEAAILAHYGARNESVQDAVAYYDDMGYPAVCDAADGRHYYLKAGPGFDGAADGWERSDGPPDPLRPQDSGTDGNGDEGQPPEGPGEGEDGDNGSAAQPASGWWHRTGIQCEPLPWEDEGDPRRPGGAQEPYARDSEAEAAVRDHYEAQGAAVEDVVAYRDDLFYPAVCEAADGRHFWLLAGDAFDGAADGWSHRGEGPPEEVRQS